MFLLIIFMSLSLVMMGCLFWVDNSWAVILDNDPGTFVDISIYLDGGLGNSGDPALGEDGDGVIPVVVGALVHGNGDQDDNKEEAFLL